MPLSPEKGTAGGEVGRLVDWGCCGVEDFPSRPPKARARTVAVFAGMLRRDQERNGLRIARASWLFGVTRRRRRRAPSTASNPTTAPGRSTLRLRHGPMRGTDP